MKQKDLEKEVNNEQLNEQRVDGEQCDKCQVRSKKEKEKQGTVYSYLLHIHSYINLWTDIGNDKEKLVS